MSEFPRLVALTRLTAAHADHVVDAAPAEREAIAARLHIPAVLALSCRFHLHAVGEQVEAKGVLQATVVQDCVVSLEPFEADLVEEFEVRFVPAGTENDIEDDPLSIDEVPYENGVIDLGEAAVEQLALSLDPYPHRPGAVLPVADPEQGPAHPFAALARLRRNS